VTSEEIINHARSLVETLKNVRENDWAKYRAARARVRDFLIKIDGPNGSFCSQHGQISSGNSKDAAIQEQEILNSYIDHSNSGLASILSVKRKAELDVVSDFLEQAQILMDIKGVHPAAPAILIGATLEEFLRSWVENEGLSIEPRKPSIDTYSTTLRSNDYITKTDVKDIASWAAVRNHAAHGEWEQLGGVERIRLMLEGVNLFMRKYSNG